MGNSIKFLTVIGLLLLIITAPSEARKRKPSRNKQQKQTQTTFTTPDSVGPVVKEKYVKRSPEEIFDALKSVLTAMSTDMEEFNFARIHPHLKIIYALYNELRLQSLGGLEAFQISDKDSIEKKETTIIYPKKGSGISDTSAASSDSTMTIIIDSTNPSALSTMQITTFKPVIEPKITDPTKMMKDKLLGNAPSSFTLSWNDTSFTKYLLKFEVTQDSLGSTVWNVVFEKVDKLKGKTVKVHRYFDAGEFAISAQDLVWLTDQVKKSETDIMNYFYAKEKDKKDKQKENDTKKEKKK